MNDDTDGFIVGGMLATALMSIVLGFIMYCNNAAWEREAVARGAAEYIIDPSTGDTTWQWKE